MAGTQASSGVSDSPLARPRPFGFKCPTTLTNTGGVIRSMPDLSRTGESKSDAEVPSESRGSNSSSKVSHPPDEHAADDRTVYADASPRDGSKRRESRPPADRPEDDLRDRVLGDFRLLRRLGQGGMAEVYLAEQISLHRQVAIKLLRPDLISDDTYLKRFEQEAKAAAALNHPNIVQVYAIGEADGFHYIAQEYVPGMNLRQFLKRKGPPDVRVALHILRQVAQALKAAGEAGIVHRDIKPENILLTRDGRVKVGDFGLALLSQTAERVQLTQEGVTMGTPLYMSPEQVNGSKVDVRSDIYSFGVTAYHLLAGRPPFQGETALSIAVKHLKEQPEELARRRPDLPRSLCRLVHRMMAKDPDERFPSAAAVLDELRRIARPLAQTGPAGQVWEDTDNEGGLFPRLWQTLQTARNRPLVSQVVLGLGLCLAVGLLAAGAGWWLRPADPLQAPSQDQPLIPKQETAARQFLHALMLVDNLDAWRAVIEYFPDAELEKRRAQQHLVQLLIRQGDPRSLEEADRICDELVGLPESEKTFRATGFAGKAIIASLRGRYQESQRIIVDELLPLQRDLQEPLAMSALIRRTIVANREKLADQVEQGLERLFDGEPQDDAVGP